MFSSKGIATALVAFALSACGGGGGGGTTETVTPVPVPTPPPVVTDYSCDPVSTLASVPKTAPYSKQSEIYLKDPSSFMVKYERWPLTIDGQANELNIAIVWPDASTPIKGISMPMHGFSSAQATAPPYQMLSDYWMFQNAMRGYIAIAVARRGNFGSTGDMDYIISTSSGAELQLLRNKYQAASMIAVLDKMTLDPLYKSYLHTILFSGGSAGADVALQTAVDSTVFKAALKKAVIRFTGGISTSYVQDPTIKAFDEYATMIAPQGVPSLWIIGEQDTLVSSGAVACQFTFYNKAAGYPNNIYVVPGVGHEVSTSTLFAPELRQIFREYMASSGFEGFN